MKLCSAHVGLLTGDGECIQCQKDELHNLIAKLQDDLNAANLAIQTQKLEIKGLTEQNQELQKQNQELQKQNKELQEG